MSNGMNRVMLFGNLGADPELRRTPSGVSVLKVRLATNRTWLGRDGVREDHTEWHNVAIFGNRGEGLARILRKGSFLLVEGRIQTHSYEKDGARRFYTEIIAEDVILGGRGSRHPDPQADAVLDDEAREASDAWADASAGSALAARSRPGEELGAEPQMGLGLDEQAGHEERFTDGPGAEDRPAARDPETIEPPPFEPKPRRGDGGSGGAEVALPPPRRKTRTPVAVPAVAA